MDVEMGRKKVMGRKKAKKGDEEKKGENRRGGELESPAIGFVDHGDYHG